MPDKWFRPRTTEEGIGYSISSGAGLIATILYVVSTSAVVILLVRAPGWFGWSVVASVVLGIIYVLVSLFAFLMLIKNKSG